MASLNHQPRRFKARAAFRASLATGGLLAVAVTAHAQTFSSTTSTTTITDTTNRGVMTPVTRTLTVTATNTITSFNGFTITGLTHSYIGDLVASISHGGTTVDLFDHIGTANPNSANYNYDTGSAALFNGNYTFAQSGTDITVVPDGTTVSTSPTYLASGNATNGFDKTNAGNTLANFVGQNVSGLWTFTIEDEQLDNTGSFTGFNFTINAAPEPSQCAALGVGLLGLGGLALRARRRNAA